MIQHTTLVVAGAHALVDLKLMFSSFALAVLERGAQLGCLEKSPESPDRYLPIADSNVPRPSPPWTFVPPSQMSSFQGPCVFWYTTGGGFPQKRTPLGRLWYLLSPKLQYPSSSTQGKACLTSQQRQKIPLGTEVWDSMFFICGIFFSVCRDKYHKSAEKPDKNHSCCWFISVLALQPGQPARLNAFVMITPCFFLQENRMSQF